MPQRTDLHGGQDSNPRNDICANNCGNPKTPPQYKLEIGAVRTALPYRRMPQDAELVFPSGEQKIFVVMERDRAFI